MGEGRVEDAERYFSRAMQHAAAFDDNDPRLATSLDNLAGVRKKQARLAEAETLYRRSLAIFERAGPRYGRQVALVCNDLGTVRCALGDFDEAVALLGRAVELNERLRGASDPEVATNLRNLAAAKLLQGKPGDAATAATRAAAIDEAASPGNFDPGSGVQQPTAVDASTVR
jgi:tetratricopeptide (TPR) repeat protein